MSALLADLKDFLADVPNERGVGDGMKAWAKELLHRLNAASTQNILDVAPQGGTGVSGTVEGHGLESGLSHATDPSGGIRTLACRALKRECTVTTKQASLDSEYRASPADSQFQTISQKQRIDAEMRLIFRSSTFTTLDPADDPRFA